MPRIVHVDDVEGLKDRDLYTDAIRRTLADEHDLELDEIEITWDTWDRYTYPTGYMDYYGELTISHPEFVEWIYEFHGELNGGQWHIKAQWARKGE